MRTKVEKTLYGWKKLLPVDVLHQTEHQFILPSGHYFLVLTMSTKPILLVMTSTFWKFYSFRKHNSITECEVMEVWKWKACNICKTGTKKLTAIQFNAKKFPLICSLMKICQWFPDKSWNMRYFETCDI